MGEERQSRKRWLLAGLALAGIALFTSLGIWQVERRTWKLALIEAVDQRVHAPPIAAPARSEWQRYSPADWQYRRVVAVGRFRHDRETLVQAVTEQGNGYWVMTPLVTDKGGTILVNRGFVPPERSVRTARSDGLPDDVVRVSGLLRISEPGGRVLRPNRPEQDRWFSRDVVAIAAARDLSNTLPYFIDADAGAPGEWPAGGLTVITFPNNHLVYALTWFGLALLCAYAVSIGVQKGPPIGVQKGPPSSSSVTGMTGAPFALVAA